MIIKNIKDLNNLYFSTLNSIISNNETWLDFLKFSSYHYKSYSFKDHVMFYAQKPSAVAVASFSQWNETFNCSVVAGATAIRTFANSPRGYSANLFDVSETTGVDKIGKWLWTVADGTELQSTVLSDIESKVANTLDFYLDELAIELDPQDEYTINTQNIKEFINNSIITCVAHRANVAHHTSDNFNYMDTLSQLSLNTNLGFVEALGYAISSRSKTVLKDIEKVVKSYEREQKQSTSNKTGEWHNISTPISSERNTNLLSYTREQHGKSSRGLLDNGRKILHEISEIPENTISQDVGENGEYARNISNNQDDRRNLFGNVYPDEATSVGEIEKHPTANGGKSKLSKQTRQRDRRNSYTGDVGRVGSQETKITEQLSLEAKREELLANWLVDFFNSLDTKYKGTFYAEKPELKIWEHINSKKKNLSIHISSPSAQYSRDSAFTYFNRDDKTDEIAINEAIYNNTFLSSLIKNNDFAITLAPDTIYIFCNNFEDKYIDFSLADTFENAAPEPVFPLSQVTPLYQGYLDVKNEYPNDIVMYPLGSFYEVLGDDAEFVANTLDLHSTYRNIGFSDERVPMCGFPDHVLEQYTQKLLDSGRNVVRVSVENGERQVHPITSPKAQEKTVTPSNKIEGYLFPNTIVFDNNNAEIVSRELGIEIQEHSVGNEVIPICYVPIELWDKEQKYLREKRYEISVFDFDTKAGRFYDIEKLEEPPKQVINATTEIVAKITPTNIKNDLPDCKVDTTYLENGTPFLIEEIDESADNNELSLSNFISPSKNKPLN